MELNREILEDSVSKVTRSAMAWMISPLTRRIELVAILFVGFSVWSPGILPLVEDSASLGQEVTAVIVKPICSPAIPAGNVTEPVPNAQDRKASSQTTESSAPHDEILPKEPLVTSLDLPVKAEKPAQCTTKGNVQSHSN